MPARGFAPAVEETAYLAIAATVDQWAPLPVALSATAGHERLVIELRASAGPPQDLVAVEDRVGALGGALALGQDSSGETCVRVELPCA